MRRKDYEEENEKYDREGEGRMEVREEAEEERI